MTDRTARESRDREKPLAVMALARLGGQADKGGAHEVRDLSGHLWAIRSHETTDEVLRIAVPAASGLAGRSVSRAGDAINVNGGAIAMGHPLGATGAVILGTLVDELERADRTLGTVSLCAAFRQAIAMVIERV